MGVRTLLLTLIFTLSACSLYQSKGRKYLESNAYQFAGVSAFVEGCGSADLSSAWQEIARSQQTISYEHQEGNLSLLQITDLPGERGCIYAFSSETELQKYLVPATEFTLLNFSLGEFAFRH